MNIPVQMKNKKILQQAFSVMTILKGTEHGKAILKCYEKKNSLHEEHRNLLIATIAKYVDAKGTKLSITQCADMEKDIHKYIFHFRKIEYYTTGKRGKLYNKIFNLKRISKGIFDDNEEPSRNMLDTFVPEADAALAVQFLRSGKVSNEELDLYWRKCSQLRFLQIKESKATSEILWPEYVKPSGHQLFDIDFKLKFPGAKDLKLKWHCTESKLLKMLQTKVTSASASALLKQLRENDEESKIFCILYSIHNLLSPQLKVESAKKMDRKPEKSSQ